MRKKPKPDNKLLRNIKPKNSANCKTASEVSQRTKQVQMKYLNSPYLTKTMKARNKFEAAVMEQSKHLRPITKQQSKWAFRECIDTSPTDYPKVAQRVWIVDIVG